MAKQTAEKQARDERKRNSRRVLSSGGVVYAESARRIEETRKETDRMQEEAAKLKQERIARNHAAAAARLQREQALA